MRMPKLKSDFVNACLAYIEAFCEKHDYDYESVEFTNKDCGGIIEISDLYIDLTTIRIDIDTNADKDEFIKWYDYSLRLGMLGATPPNYDSWLRKCPIKSEAEILEIEALREKIEGLKEELTNMCK